MGKWREVVDDINEKIGGIDLNAPNTMSDRLRTMEFDSVSKGLCQIYQTEQSNRHIHRTGDKRPQNGYKMSKIGTYYWGSQKHFFVTKKTSSGKKDKQLTLEFN